MITCAYPNHSLTTTRTQADGTPLGVPLAEVVPRKAVLNPPKRHGTKTKAGLGAIKRSAIMAEIGIPDVKSWRRRKGISLERFYSLRPREAERLRQLDAIENGDFKRLPGGIYNTSYIRQYAQAIGFDETDLLAYYYQVVKLAAGKTAAAGSEDTRSIALDDLRKRRIPCPATVPPAEVR